MWIPVTLIAGMSVSVLLPWIIFSAITEKGRIKKGKLICKCPRAVQIILLIGVIMFSFFVVLLLKKEMKGIEIALLIIMSFFDLILIIPCYICFRYKIIMDIEQGKIIIHRLCMLKKVINFSRIFKMEGNELAIVKDENNRKLFYYSMYMAGSGCLSNCIKIIIRNNQKNEPIDIKELQKMFDYEKE